MAVLLANSVESFESAVGGSGPGLRLLHFRADFAPQCAQMSIVLDELAKEAGNAGVVFVNIEAEQVPEVTRKFHVSSVPTFVLARREPDGRVVEVDRLSGADPAALTKKLAAVVSSSSSSTSSSSKKPVVDLDARLRSLINRSPVVLFMKGDPEEPRCGFSRTIVQLLKQHCPGGVFDHFDILSDNAVREGLKKLSNWPTYPQLYVKGELLGGLDIVQEMIEAEELAPQLKSAVSEYLDGLVRQQRVMLFMKGSPDEPRCGFSRKIVAILREEGIDFGHFNILADQFVREALKVHSNWPTYPQVYHDGQLIGGLDIINEMRDDGELKSTLAS